MIVVQVNGLAFILIQLLDERVKLMRDFSLGGIFERTRFLRLASLPPVVALPIEAVPLSAPIDIRIVRDAMKPCGETGAMIELRERSPRFGKCALRQVRRVLIVSAKPAKVGEDALVK